MDRVVGGKYKLGRKLGSGSFGELFLGIQFSFFVTYNVLLFGFVLLLSFALFSRSECAKWRRSCCQACKWITQAHIIFDAVVIISSLASFL